MHKEDRGACSTEVTVKPDQDTDIPEIDAELLAFEDVGGLSTTNQKITENSRTEPSNESNKQQAKDAVETTDFDKTNIDSEFAIKEREVVLKKQIAAGDIDRESRKENAIESDRDYRKITNTIIEKTSKQLDQHTDNKKPLRIVLMIFVMVLLACQFATLVVILFCNEAKELGISDYVINVYIVSMFVETLAGLIIMIQFAFDSKQEVELIKILNAIVRHFKKYEDK